MHDPSKSLIEIHTIPYHRTAKKSLPTHFQFLKPHYLHPTSFYPPSPSICASSQIKQQGLLMKISVLQPALPQGGEECTPGGGSQSTTEGFKEPQSHRMLGVGKDLCGSPSSSVLPLGAEPSSLSRAEVELILKPVSGGGQGLRNTCPTASIFFLHRGRCGLGSSMSHKLSAKRISV